jgi:hypothetical protein
LTVNVYAVSFVRPVILIGEDVPEAVVPSLAVTTYPVIGEPPSVAGAVNEIEALASPAEATTLVGALGTVEGVTALEALDCADVPIPFVAVTLNVYG